MKKQKLTKAEKKLAKELENTTEKLNGAYKLLLIIDKKKGELEKQVEQLQKEKEALSENKAFLDSQLIGLRRTIGKYDENTKTFDRCFDTKIYLGSIDAFIGFICGQNALYKEMLTGKRVETHTIAGTVTK